MVDCVETCQWFVGGNVLHNQKCIANINDSIVNLVTVHLFACPIFCNQIDVMTIHHWINNCNRKNCIGSSQ